MRVGLPGILLLVVTGCSPYTPLDEDIRARVGEDELAKLQFYVSSDILLWRVLRNEETGVTAKHSLRIDKGRRLEEILISAGTPGVIVKAEKMKLCVSFEAPIAGQEVYITFVKGNNGNKEGYFMYPDAMNQGDMMVKYGGTDYVAVPESRIAYLQVEQDKVKVSSHALREVSGRRVEEPQK